MHQRIATLFLLAGLLNLLAACPGQAAEPIRIGVAEADITPPAGFPMAGYYHERLAVGTRDPLKAKAVVFSQGDQSAVFVATDLIGISRDLCVEVRRRATAKTGIPSRYIAISATHSHTAPDYTRHVYEFLGGKKPADGSRPYAARLIDGIVAAVVEAHGKAQPALVEAGSGQQQTPVSFNRRFVMKDGSVRTWQRLDNPEVVRAAGPIDPEIGLLLIRSVDEKTPLGVLSNFALHLDTVGGVEWSADYPYFIEQALRKQLGEKVVSIFGNGACGDINHVDPVNKDRNKTDFIGNSLAATITEALPQLRPVEDPTFKVRTATVDLPLAKVNDRHLEQAVELIPLAKSGKKVEFFDLVLAYRAVILDHLRNKPPRLESTDYLSWGLSRAWAGVGESLPVEVMTMTFGGDVAIVFLPGEEFVELGLSIKRGSPYATTLVIELSNCVETVYVPTRAAYAGGSYEVTNSTVQPGAGEMLVETALRLLRESASSP